MRQKKQMTFRTARLSFWKIYGFFSDLKIPTISTTMTFTVSLLAPRFIRYLAYERLVASWCAFLGFLAKQPLIQIAIPGQCLIELLGESLFSFNSQSMHGAPVISCLLHGNEIAFGNPVALVVGERLWFGELIEGKSVTHAPKAILLLSLCSVFCYFKNGLAEYLHRMLMA